MPAAWEWLLVAVVVLALVGLVFGVGRNTRRRSRNGDGGVVMSAGDGPDRPDPATDNDAGTADGGGGDGGGGGD